jgi:hypothetical protein
MASLAAAAAATVALSMPASLARAQGAEAAQQATLSEGAKSDSGKAAAPQATNAGNVAAVDSASSSQQANPSQQNPAQQKSLTTKAIENVKAAAKSASDIFSRVPCLAPKGGAKSMGSLPHVASKLASGEPVVIIAFGSSSTVGYGTTSPEFTYPNRLAAQLHRQYPSADITVVNRGQGADLVLVDPQYSPRVNEHAESTGQMVKLLGNVAQLRHVGFFPRFEVMREWHEKQAIPIDDFVISDGLHMTDWGYACFAQLLGDDIIKSVGQIKLGINVPSDVRTYRPM